MPENNTSNSLPQWAKNAIAKAENESRRYKQELSAVEKLLTKTKDHIPATEIDAHIEERKQELLREGAGLRNGIDPSHWKRINGTTKEEIEHDARLLANVLADD